MTRLMVIGLISVFIQACSGFYDIKSLYQKYGDVDYIGENISILNHSLQASYIAYYEYNNLILARAAFLHDIGHLLNFNKTTTCTTILDSFGGNYYHEYDGYQYIFDHYNQNLYIEKYLILNHANAKRYLVSKYSNYYDTLSKSSQHTFDFNQGSYMTEYEMIRFETMPYFTLSIMLRRIDDQSKNQNVYDLWDLDTAFYLLFF